MEIYLHERENNSVNEEDQRKESYDYLQVDNMNISQEEEEELESGDDESLNTTGAEVQAQIIDGEVMEQSLPLSKLHKNVFE